MISSLALLVSFSVLALNTTDCDQLLEDYREQGLQLDYQAFDQTQGSGFRWLAAQGCPSQAADLIEAYIEAHGGSQRSLVWHLAQMRGESGEVTAAIEAALQSLDMDESTDAPFRWNAHVLAYLAVLEGDREAFDRSLAELLAASDRHQGNQINASMWQKLSPYFDLGYAQAIRSAYGIPAENNDEKEEKQEP